MPHPVEYSWCRFSYVPERAKGFCSQTLQFYSSDNKKANVGKAKAFFYFQFSLSNTWQSAIKKQQEATRSDTQREQQCGVADTDNEEVGDGRQREGGIWGAGLFKYCSLTATELPISEEKTRNISKRQMRQPGQTRQTRHYDRIRYDTICCQKNRVCLLERGGRWKGVGAKGAERLSCF